MNEISKTSLNIAEDVFQIHGIDRSERTVIHRQSKRGRVVAFFGLGDDGTQRDL